MIFPYNSQDYSKKDVIEILKRFQFDSNCVSKLETISFSYQNPNSNDCNRLRSEWKIPEAFGIDHSLNNMMRIMRWYINIFPKKKTTNDEIGIQKLLGTAEYQVIQRKYEQNGLSLSHLHEALFFLYTLLSLGYKARLVECLPLSINTTGLFKVEVLVDIGNRIKWIAVDLENSWIITDEDGVPLNIVEIRNKIINNSNLFCLSFDKQIKTFVAETLTENLFMIKYYLDSCINLFSKKRIRVCILAHEFLCCNNKEVFDAINDRTIEYSFTSNKNYIYSYL